MGQYEESGKLSWRRPDEARRSSVFHATENDLSGLPVHVDHEIARC